MKAGIEQILSQFRCMHIDSIIEQRILEKHRSPSRDYQMLKSGVPKISQTTLMNPEQFEALENIQFEINPSPILFCSLLP